MHANLLEKKKIHTMLNRSYTLAHKRIKNYASDLWGILFQNDEVSGDGDIQSKMSEFLY